MKVHFVVRSCVEFAALVRNDGLLNYSKMDIRLAMKSKTKLNMNVEFGTPEKTQHFQEHEIYFYILPTGTHSKLGMSR